MNRRAVILSVLTLTASILAALPVQINAMPRTIVVSNDYQTVSSAIGNATAVTLNLTAQTETTVSLSWTLARDAIPGYGIIVGYELFMSSTGINGQYAKIWNTLDNQRMSTNVDGLSPDTEYYFYLVATGLSGNYKSNTVQVTTAAKADDAGATLAASPHEIVIDSPNNHTVYNDSLTLNVTIKFLESDGLIYWQTLSTLNYSLDNNPPVDIITNAGLAQMGSPVNLTT